MKKFLIILSIIVVIIFVVNYMYYHLGIYIYLNNEKEVSTFVKTQGKDLIIDNGSGYERFIIKGVNMGAGFPGFYATEYAIDKETYLRWFGYIKEMGANVLRVYTILHSEFYDAFYEFNQGNENPLYLIHGVWVDDYIQNSSFNAYHEAFCLTFLKDCKTLVDVIHGRRKLNLGKGLGLENYNKDVSPWVIGYILGVEWEDVTVAFTDETYPERNSYKGEYLYTTEDASPFEAMLASVGNQVIEYESKRYGTQRLIAFSNWSTTDPFDYPKFIADFFFKIAKVDVEHIKTTENFIAGHFSSYHIYPYYPDYLNYIGEPEEYIDYKGNVNTYFSYLKKINQHHTIPVVISEFGVPSSRGMAQRDINTGRSQGFMSEQQQGTAILECFEDIMNAGCAGGIVFTWHDEWFKRTWNTMHSVDLTQTPYWSDYQTNEQYFGLLSFDPGIPKSICYVDGDIGEWTDKDIVIKDDHAYLSVKYDQKFIYFLAYKNCLQDDEVLYIPIDTTQKSGSEFCEKFNIGFNRKADFVIVIDGKQNSKVLVQERYEVLKAMYGYEVFGENSYVDVPCINSPVFKPIYLVLQTATPLIYSDLQALAETYETGLLMYGNANPQSYEYNSLADFCKLGDFVEIKIPWQLLNFSAPNEMLIHDDYYELTEWKI